MKLQLPLKLQPITKLSPTLFATLKKCQLRAGLRQVNAQQTTKSSTAAMLGTIVHRVLEKARTLNRDSSDLRTQAETIWDKTVEDLEDELQSSPLDRSLLPITRWKRYYLLRERTILRCEDIVSSQGTSETKMIASERNFNSIKHGFTGKPDLILRRADGLVIIDYKSSELSEDSQEREEIIQLWQQQVLFYASIVKEEFGEWPVGGEIRLLNKEVIPIPIDPQKAAALLVEAQSIKEEYNTRVAAGTSYPELAQYSVDNCTFCEFKGICNTFWKESPQPIPGTDKYGCLSGKIKKITSTKRGISRLEIVSEKINDELQQWEITGLSKDKFEILEELTQGDSVRLIDFAIDSEKPYQAKPTQTSVIWKVP